MFVDSGALLYKYKILHESPHKQQVAELTARGIAKASQAMGCMANGIARLELDGGIDRLQKIEQNSKLTWLSMNLTDKAGHPVFTPMLITKTGSTTIALLGLTDNGLSKEDQDNYAIVPWQEILPRYLQQARKEADMVILLSSYPEPINREIAQSVDGIHIILQADHSSVNQPPLQVKNTLLTRVATRGKYLGMLRIHWTDTGKWGQDFTEKIRSAQEKLDRINWQIGRLEKRDQPEQLTHNKLYKKLQLDQQTIEQTIAELRKKKEQALAEPCSYTSRFIALKSSMPDDPEVEKIIEQTTMEVNTLNQNRVRPAAARNISALVQLAGSNKCSECHVKQADFWMSTRHAKAWNTLAEVNQQFNDDCLICHVTLPFYQSERVKNEQLLVQLPKKFRDVGCESCHGGAANHAMNPENSLPAKPDQLTCLQCHTDEHSEEFIYADRLPLIRCPKG